MYTEILDDNNAIIFTNDPDEIIKVADKLIDENIYSCTLEWDINSFPVLTYETAVNKIKIALIKEDILRYILADDDTKHLEEDINFLEKGITQTEKSFEDIAELLPEDTPISKEQETVIPSKEEKEEIDEIKKRQQEKEELLKKEDIAKIRKKEEDKQKTLALHQDVQALKAFRKLAKDSVDLALLTIENTASSYWEKFKGLDIVTTEEDLKNWMIALTHNKGKRRNTLRQNIQKKSKGFRISIDNIPGNVDKEGKPAPWVIIDHNRGGKLMASFPTEEAAKQYFKNMAKPGTPESEKYMKEINHYLRRVQQLEEQAKATPFPERELKAYLQALQLGYNQLVKFRKLLSDRYLTPFGYLYNNLTKYTDEYGNTYYSYDDKNAENFAKLQHVFDFANRQVRSSLGDPTEYHSKSNLLASVSGLVEELRNDPIIQEEMKRVDVGDVKEEDILEPSEIGVAPGSLVEPGQ